MSVAVPVAGATAALLRDGGQVLLRPYQPADRPAIRAMFDRLSPASRALRFHGPVPSLSDDLLNRVVSGHALLAEVRDQVVGLGNHIPLRDPTRAEVAFTVEDAQQGRGIGTLLFERLADDARQEGVNRFTALVLATNQQMIEVLAGLGFRMSRHLEYGELEYEIVLDTGPEVTSRSDQRRHRSAALSLQPLFEPRSVAVVGASRRAGSVGHELFRNILAGGFDGPVYPVNLQAHSVAGVRAYPKVSDIPDQVDLAVVVVPSDAVVDVARDSLEAGAQALVVVSVGFAEIGEQGRQQQDELLRLCRSHEARLVGPNCLGVLARRPDGWLNATFAPSLPPAGNVAIASQSGALGIAILGQARSLGIGVSAFVSMGNKADLSSNDLLERWEDDPNTGAIVLYLESFGNPRRFARVARRVGARKPIITVKGGRGQAGKKAAASHTAAMAGSNQAVDALFRQSGVIRCDALEEAFEVASLVSKQPLPAGSRVGIVTNAGGLGILAADACESRGLALPPVAAGTRTLIERLLPAETHVANPLDLVATCTPQIYGQALRALLADPGIDSVIAMFIATATNDGREIEQAIAAAARTGPAKPILACFPDEQLGAEARAAGVPIYRFPEAASRALGHAAERSVWLHRPAGQLPAFDGIDRVGARTVVQAALARENAPWLSPTEAAGLLTAYDIQTPRSELVRSGEEAAAAYRRLGRPVVMKLVTRGVLHKTDIGGVRLNVASPTVAATVFGQLKAIAHEHGLADVFEGVLVQEMAGTGVECFIGVVNDELFGPLIAFGLGGVTAELMGDVGFRLHPLTDVDTDELIASVRASKLLAGYRGQPAADVPALREMLLRLSVLVEDVPEIADMDLNPVIVAAGRAGVMAVDARVRLHG